jgi:integrase
MTASTAAATGSADLPLGDELVLSERPLRPGAILAETARFGDDVWPLNPAQLQHHQDRMRLNFALVPAPYRQTAKRLFYAMLSGDLPPGERRPRVATTPVLLVEVKRFFCWLEQHFADHRQPPPALICLSAADLQAYREHVTAALSPVRAARACVAVRYLWRYRRVMPDHLPFDPLREVDKWSMDPRFRSSENKTARIPEQVLGPLVTWSLRFVDDFAPDILAAHRIWTNARNPNRPKPARYAEPTALLELLDTHLRDRRPIPGREGRVNLKFLSDVTGVTRERVSARRDLIDRVAAIVGVSERSCFDIEIGGQLDGQPWIEAIASDYRYHDSLAALCRMLQISCYTIISYLSGMRDSEVKHLRRECIQAQRDSNGNPYRWRIHSRAFKGEHVEGVDASWVVCESVARAVSVLEQLQAVDHDLLFAALPHSPGKKHLHGRALTTYTTCVQLNDFRDWINQYCARNNRADTIPPVNGRPWTFSTSQFRRSLAWFIARQPGGSIAGAIQYRHMSIQMFEGYAGTSDSGFRAEVEAEIALARGEHLLAAVEAHEHTQYTGPAADEADGRLDEFGHQAAFTGTVVTDPRRLARLMNNHDPAIYPGRYATCVFNPDKALCIRTTDTAGTLRPALGDCKPLECNNVALTADNIAALQAERAAVLDEVAKRPTLPPMLHHRLTARAEAIAAFIARHNNRS